MIHIVDFGSQTTHLIARRLRDLGVMSVIITPDIAVNQAKADKPSGIILSGGPMSVYEADAPTIDKEIFSLGIPLLGICYGMQLMAYLLGGKVISGKKEYGPATLHLHEQAEKYPIAASLPHSATVWMSHGDEVVAMPEGFETVGSTAHVPFAFTQNIQKKIFGIQFHPEVEHTEIGERILQNFISISEAKVKKYGVTPEEMIEKIKKTVGNKHVIGAISGGVDSTVAGTLVAKAIGKQFTPIFVDNGLMRDDAVITVKKAFEKYAVQPIVVDVREEMLKRLQGLTDSEEKRKAIGKFYIEVFEKEMTRLRNDATSRQADVGFLLQGTIYSDVIESQGSKHAAKIKSHHNVGGLPEEMKLQLLEPLRELYKDEVRALGKKIGLGDEFVHKQPFPGPGYAIRIRGEVTPERLAQEKQADVIVLEELRNADLLKNIFISFPVMTDAYSTAVKGDGRFFGEVVALRIIESKDVMTTTWSRLPYDVLQTISSRIVNEVPNISRVVYDITTKPPATMEWE